MKENQKQNSKLYNVIIIFKSGTFFPQIFNSFFQICQFLKKISFDGFVRNKLSELAKKNPIILKNAIFGTVTYDFGQKTEEKPQQKNFKLPMSTNFFDSKTFLPV